MTLEEVGKTNSFHFDPVATVVKVDLPSQLGLRDGRPFAAAPAPQPPQPPPPPRESQADLSGRDAMPSAISGLLASLKGLAIGDPTDSVPSLSRVGTGRSDVVRRGAATDMVSARGGPAKGGGGLLSLVCPCSNIVLPEATSSASSAPMRPRPSSRLSI
eukprot:TRINITY_DN30701_c0_g1_i1.p2 TRINITY_DN30701_c0_g1~~TRINITY_DN30701_c0_g1_i1.p2  ORF type:complete len:159 (+),score=24.37 TRINITY_DN30701_c0_g1_i1:141-617(+)